MAGNGNFSFADGRGTLAKIQTSNSENKDSGPSVRAQTLDELHSVQKRKSVSMTPMNGAQGAFEQMSQVTPIKSSLLKNEINSSFENVENIEYQDILLRSRANIGNLLRDWVTQPMNPQRQSPMPVIDDPCIFENATSIPIPWVYKGSLKFQDGYGNNKHSNQIPNEAYREHIPFQEMQPYYLNVNKSSYKRRNRRFNLRRDFRCKEEHPYRRHDKTFTHNNCNYKRLEELPPQAKDENKTQFSEEGLKFLLQTKLQSCDVSSLGRIVLPTRDAEAYLPHLVTQEGIMISVQDRENNITWHLKYTYWPINNTRIYVLENTEQFVQTHGLQKGDYMMLYKDAHDKFVLTGRKATELDGSKPYTINSEAKVEEIEDGIGKISLVDCSQ